MNRMPGRLLILAGLLAVALPVFGGTVEQRIELEPGWNAIYLEVAPEQPEIEQVFAGIPVASVWRWIPDERTVDFIRDPDEDLLTIDGWYGYFPSDRPESLLTNLFMMHANTAYLVRLQGSQPVTLTVRGKPELRPYNWRSNGFQFTGFHVDPDLPPTLGSWFAGSEAHQNQPVYRLVNGTWQVVTQPQVTRIRPGEAYWVYTSGNSRFQGPLEVALEFGSRIRFGSELSRDELMLRNHSGVANQVTLRQLSGAAPVPLALMTTDPDTGERFWPELPAEATLDLGVDEGMPVTLGVRRDALLNGEAEHIIAISNGLGVRRLVTVSAQSVHLLGEESLAEAHMQGLARGERPAGRSVVSNPYAGLWLGVASVDAVSMAQQGGVTPLPTGQEFPLRVLIHVDGLGNARLLKEVIQMWEDGTEVPVADEPGFTTTETPGRFVLLTDDSLIPNYSGAVMRDNTPVGLRFSTAAFDFPGNELDLSGVFSPTGLLSTTIVLEPDFPTNPYLHRYHPDHDNLDTNFLNFRAEAYEVTREIQFSFTQDDPEGFDPPEWGANVMGGTYLEAISGIHRSTIFVSGTFRLNRVSPVVVLNQ